MRKQKKSLSDQRGMSLVEMLVAITILVIVVVPLLHAFVTSATTNRKARIQLEATRVAEDVMEKIKSEELDQLLNGKTPDAGGIYKLEYKNQDINGKKYDAYVTLNPTDYIASDPSSVGVTDYNSKETTQILDTSNRSTASYIMKTDMDEGIAEDGFPGASWNFPAGLFDSTQACKEALLHKGDGMDRTITVKITKDTAGITSVTISIEYTYEYTYNSVTDKKTVDPVYEQTIYESQNPGVALKNLYLYYEPIYHSAAAGMPKETIRIENPQLVPVDVYLLRQNKNVLHASDSSMIDDTQASGTYGIRVQVIEPRTTYTPGDYVTRLHANRPNNDTQVNLQWGTSATGPLVTPPSEAKIGTASVPLKELLGLTDVVSTTKGNVIYGVTVDVFKQGEGGGTGDALASITGTKEK